MFRIYTKWLLWAFANLIFLKKRENNKNNGAEIFVSYANFSEASETRQYPIPLGPHIWYKQYTFSNLDRLNKPVPNASTATSVVEAMHIFKP
jgi:hypothetical protein